MTRELPEIDSMQLESDIKVAVRHRVPVLITAPVDDATTIVRAIAESIQHRPAAEVVTCDSATCDDIVAAIAGSGHGSGTGRDTIVWLKDVHGLKPTEQAVTMDLLTAWRTDRMPRIIASSSVDLFDLVKAGAFDARLFYRLNTIHIIVPPPRAEES
jgi:hypothetical protein